MEFGSLPQTLMRSSLSGLDLSAGQRSFCLISVRLRLVSPITVL